MTKPELTKAFEIAKSNTELADNLSLFDGFGLKDFQPVYCSLQDVAKLIRWQCQTFGGTWDMNAFQEIAHFGKKKFIIVA